MGATTPISSLSHSYISSDSVDEAEVKGQIQPEEENASAFNAPQDSETGGGLQSLSVLFANNVNALSSIVYTTDELGQRLVSFSKLSEAKAFLGPDVTTQYYMLTAEGDLQPLRQKKSAKVDVTNPSKYSDTYEPFGDPISVSLAAKPNLEQFAAMHSLDQKAMAQLFGSSSSGAYSLTYYDNANQPVLTAVQSFDGKKLYLVEKLTKNDFSAMPYADQVVIAGSPSFDKIKITLGFGATKAEIESLLNSELAKINNIFNTALATAKTAAIPGQTQVPLTNQVGFFTREHLALFTDQIEMMRENISDNLAIYSSAQISDQLSALTERFERAFAFGNIPIAAITTNPLVLSDDPTDAVKLVGSIGTGDNGVNTGNTAYINLLSDDKNQTIKAGFDLFITQEKTRIEAEKAIAALLYQSANPDPDNASPMGGPQLMFQLQLYRNIIVETDLSTISEVVRQQNVLISSYSKMQESIDETLKKGFANLSDKEAAYLAPSNTNKYTEATTMVVSMFQNHAGAANRKAPTHPLEVLRQIERPFIGAFSTTGVPEKLSRMVWSQYASQLKDTVSIIGQDLNSNSSKANTMEKDKTRNTQLASQLNTRMYEAIMQLARLGFW